MSEVSSVSKLIAALLAIALTAGAAGTLVDLLREAKGNAAKTLRTGPMSYGIGIGSTFKIRSDSVDFTILLTKW